MNARSALFGVGALAICLAFIAVSWSTQAESGSEVRPGVATSQEYQAGDR